MKTCYSNELLELLIRVNAMVALQESHTLNPSTNSKKQIPQIQSQLTKTPFFRIGPNFCTKFDPLIDFYLRQYSNHFKA